jgi:signal transduction histidine kinase
LKVRSYIALLTAGGLGGAVFIALLGWFTFSGLKKSTSELQEESKKTGDSSEEYSDAQAFLQTTRGIFVALEIYPKTFPGVFNVAMENMALAKEGLNKIGEYPQFNKTLLEPIAKNLKGIEQSILQMEKFSPWKEDAGWEARNVKARADYEKIRDDLKRSLDNLELVAEQQKIKSEKAMASKWEDLRSSEDSSKMILIFTGLIYFIFVCLLAFLTYKSFASPIKKLEDAARRSIEFQKPFTHKESGPYEVRSVTRQLKGLIVGLEDTVRRRTAALETSNQKLSAEMKQRIELETQLVHAQKMEAVGQLASGIAHEINSPSQFANDNILFLKDAVEGFIAKIDQTENSPDDKEISFLKENAPEAVAQAKEGISRITTIVKSMKNFAYRDAESAKKPNDLNQAIQSTTVVATNEWKYHAHLQLELDENLPLVPCNVGEINQVVLNLIVNGAHAIRDRFPEGQKGTLVVKSQFYPDAMCVVISIADNGGGIPEKVQNRIFEPFFTTKEVGVGTGQGLAIAHNVVVKSHKGQLWFDSKDGHGTVFYIKLPMEQEASS